ncbi:phosphonate C-P lyase system protein PhnH [Plastoroseomonas arctica]|uniref:Phosphonate C-P lyase system protein PhnH n=1 Tax=Plastoroseomonas arctica TaxID=1509237 RepID=A0AAF1K3G0_9PROT|nr:phosphonate C-P lyase system protein PhnH [Plastoroseomonas arctica]MBR0654995.1 phosphonate C-P lyase system protein PhnH [Plastoroseomonas arctica]
MSALQPGFADPVLDAQASFRAVLEAMSRPGRIIAITTPAPAPAPLNTAAAAVLLTLADAETPVCSDAGDAVAGWLGFHAGCPFTPAPDRARFVLATGAAPALTVLDAGTEEEPQTSATLIVQVEALAAGEGWRLTGPGIESEHRLRVYGLPEDFLSQWQAQRARFPRGVDVVLCAGDRLAALPRSVTIEEG